MSLLRTAFAALSVFAALSSVACTKNKDAKEATNTPAAAGDIVAVATAAGSFNTLLAAATAADLVSTLQGPGPFTVFAPTDEAFAKIPKADLDALLANKEALKTVLLSHVVAGKVLAADVTKMTDGSPVSTASGKSITVGLTGGVTFGGAKVVKTDIAASNGVIHVIDTVVIPK